MVAQVQDNQEMDDESEICFGSLGSDVDHEDQDDGEDDDEEKKIDDDNQGEADEINDDDDRNIDDVNDEEEEEEDHRNNDDGNGDAACVTIESETSPPVVIRASDGLEEIDCAPVAQTGAATDAAHIPPAENRYSSSPVNEAMKMLQISAKQATSNACVDGCKRVKVKTGSKTKVFRVSDFDDFLRQVGTGNHCHKCAACSLKMQRLHSGKN